MSSLAIAAVMFTCVLGSALAAMWLARRLPDHHLSSESKDSVKMGLGIIATLTALVLGLLVAATKGTYDAQSATIRELSAQLALLDRVLARYGPEAKEARGQVRVLTQAVLDQIWPHDASGPKDLSGGESKNIGEALLDSVAALQPSSEVQRMLKARALDTIVGLGQIRQRLIVQYDRSIPTLFLVVLGFWQAILFAGFGLLAPRNATAATVLMVCVLSISAAIFLVLELDRPFDGIVRVSDAPLRLVLSHMSE